MEERHFAKFTKCSGSVRKLKWGKNKYISLYSSREKEDIKLKGHLEILKDTKALSGVTQCSWVFPVYAGDTHY